MKLIANYKEKIRRKFIIAKRNHDDIEHLVSTRKIEVK